jgi:hypothetical protein
MKNWESRLLSRWQEMHERGVVAFVLRRGILFYSLPFSVAFFFAFRFWLAPKASLGWRHFVFTLLAFTVVAMFAELRTWQKMERLYEGRQRESRVQG